MNPGSEPAYRDPWDDPDFAPGGMARFGNLAKLVPGAAANPPARRRLIGPSLILALVILGAIGLGLLLDPVIGRMMLTLALAFGVTLGVLAFAMGLGVVGFGLFAIAERLIGWVCRGARWPEE